MKISVLGLGYMGLPTAALFAKANFDVLGIDINENKVAEVNKGRCPFSESGMSELVYEAHKTGKLRASTKLEKSDVFIIAVPTPTIKNKADLKFVRQAMESVSKVLSKGNLVVLESTVKPNTCKNVVKPILDKAGVDYHLAHCPERAIPGNTIYELINNDRIVGGLTLEDSEITKELYQHFVKGKIFLTDITIAETTKLVENTYRDINIAFSNELAMISEDLKINVWEMIELANKHPRVNVHQPGPGVGGHCIAVDPWFLTEDTSHAKMINLARITNSSMPNYVVDFAKDKVKPGGTVTLLGLAYKKNIDDYRESPAGYIMEILENEGYRINITDPFIKENFYGKEVSDFKSAIDNSDICILVTDHDEYKLLSDDDFGCMRGDIIYDTRNCLNKSNFKQKKVILLGDSS